MADYGRNVPQSDSASNPQSQWKSIGELAAALVAKAVKNG